MFDLGLQGIYQRFVSPRITGLKRLPLPLLSLLIGVAVGLAVWFVMDQIQTRALRDIFQEELQTRLEQRAGESLVRFDQYVMTYATTTQLLASHRRLVQYLEFQSWDEADAPEPIYHLKEPPEWLPRESQWISVIEPRFVIMFDDQHRAREVYAPQGHRLPEELSHGSWIYVGESKIKPFLTVLDEGAYMLVTREMEDSFGTVRGDMMTVVALDDTFLAATQVGAMLGGAFIAIVDAHNQTAYVSSDHKRVPPGSQLGGWLDDYVVASQSFFEREGSDLNVQFATLVPRSGMLATTSKVSSLERLHRFIGAVVYIAVFSMLFYLVSMRLNKLLRRISSFSQRALGIQQSFPEGGNQLLVLEDWMQNFVRLVRRAGDEMRLRHESEIRESESVRKAIFATSPDAIITVDESGRILDCNGQAERLFGYEREQLDAQELADKLLVGSDQSLFRDILATSHLLEGPREASAHREMLARRSGSKTFPVEVSVMPITLQGRLAYTVYLHDISRRKKDEQEIESLAKFAAESPSPVLRVNSRGVIVYANHAAKPLLEYWDCQRGQTLPLYWRKQVARVMNRGWDVELELVREGQIFSLLLAPIIDLDYVNIYGRDITAVRQAEQRSRQHQAELVHVCRLSTMGEMATGLAHELNQPLSAIGNYANGIKRRLQQDVGARQDLLDATSQISLQAERAGQIIRRLRGLIGKQLPDRSVVDINNLVKEVVSFVEHETMRADLEIELDLEPEGLPVRVDLVQIEQVLLNLVRNAMDALQDVPEAKRRLLIATHAEGGDSVRVEVRDSGSGIESDIMQHLFDAFFTTKASGMGMGLPISKTIIEDHGGRIWAESQVGAGTSFFIVLPNALDLAEPEKLAGNMK